MEQINFAAEQYMNMILSDKKDEVHEEEVNEEPNVMDKYLFYEQTENLYNFDKDGNIIYEEESAEDDDVEENKYDDENYILFRTEGKEYRVWKLLDTIVVDVSGITLKQADQVIAELWQSRDPKGFYRVMLSMNDRLVDTKFKVEDIDTSKISDMILKMEKVVR